MIHHHRSKDRVSNSLDAIVTRLEHMESLLACVQLLTESLMTDKQDVLNEIQALRDLITQDNSRDQQAMDQLSATNQALRAQIQTLQEQHGADPSDFAEILGQLDSVRSLIQPINTDATLQNISAENRPADSMPLSSTDTQTTPTSDAIDPNAD